MIRIEENDDEVRLETDALKATVRKRGYVSGTAAGSLVDKQTGARDPGFGCHIADFLLAPGWREDGYGRDPLLHGPWPKHYVEGPQICTQAGYLPVYVDREGEAVLVSTEYTFTEAGEGYAAGSRWEQRLLFEPGKRYFLSSDVITMNNSAVGVSFRLDMPCHLKHQRGDTFLEVYLSYAGHIPPHEFYEDFGPHEKFCYERGVGAVPSRMIRAQRLRLSDGPGPWLAGMTLQPEVVWQAWCHQRGYVCFIQEIGGLNVEKGDVLRADYVVGYFDSMAKMERTYDEERARLGF